METRLERALFGYVDAAFVNKLKNKKLILHVANFEYALLDGDKNYGEIAQFSGGLRTQSKEVLEEDIQDALQGYRNLIAQGFNIEYWGPKNLKHYMLNREVDKEPDSDWNIEKATERVAERHGISVDALLSGAVV